MPGGIEKPSQRAPLLLIAQSGRPAISPVSHCKSPERIVAHVQDPAPKPT